MARSMIWLVWRIYTRNSSKNTFGQVFSTVSHCAVVVKCCSARRGDFPRPVSGWNKVTRNRHVVQWILTKRIIFSPRGYYVGTARTYVLNTGICYARVPRYTPRPGHGEKPTRFYCENRARTQHNNTTPLLFYTDVRTYRCSAGRSQFQRTKLRYEPATAALYYRCCTLVKRVAIIIYHVNIIILCLRLHSAYNITYIRRPFYADEPSDSYTSMYAPETTFYTTHDGD